MADLLATGTAAAHARRPSLRVVICEDSRTYAHALRAFLETDGDLEVVKVCTSAEQLLRSLDELDPQLITMDLELPAMDGLAATREVMRRSPTPIVVISSHTARGDERAAATLASGALEALAKEDLQLDRADSPASIALRRRLRRLALSRSLRPPASRPTGPGPPAATSAPVAPTAARVSAARRAPAVIAATTARRVAAIAIVASTGGPQALGAVLGELPRAFDIPILVVQHMSPGFIGGLARWLDGTIALPVGLAQEGERATRGVWLAPDARHLSTGPGLRMHLDDGPDGGYHRPSADALLRSMARLRAQGAAVVLTGMGRDGAQGVAAMVAAGGLVIAEDASTAVVNGMPAAAVKAGAQSSLPLYDIAVALAALRLAR